jgi:branched-chain amino acid transport system permease protein
MMPIRPFRFFWPLLSLSIVLLAICTLTVLLGSGQNKQIVTEMMIRVVLVVGIYIFVGNSGILSFGHISFMTIGAYAAAWFTCCTLPMVKPMYLPSLPEFLQNSRYPLAVGLTSAALLCGIVSLVVGVAVLRLSGVAASIATFALLMITFSVYSNWDGMTGGSSSVSNIPVEVGPWLSTSIALGVLAAAFFHQVSRYGLMLRATRDDGVAARAAGIETLSVRLVAFVLSAICVGVGGALYSSFLGVLTVDSFYLSITFLTLAMLTVGGTGSLAGAVTGVLFVTAVTELFRAFERGVSLGTSLTLQIPHGLQEVSLGIIMILVLILRPGGLMNGYELLLPLRDVAPEGLPTHSDPSGSRAMRNDLVA